MNNDPYTQTSEISINFINKRSNFAGASGKNMDKKDLAIKYLKLTNLYLQICMCRLQAKFTFKFCIYKMDMKCYLKKIKNKQDK